MADGRVSDLLDFYAILAALQTRLGKSRTLANCSGRLSWPRRGVYFFMEEGESRSDSGIGPRIVRVGTHALTESSKTRLWTRLSQHRGQIESGGGNHRGSVFRKIVGKALIARRELNFPTWGQGNNASVDVRLAEFLLECEVSKTIGAMPFLWLAVEDDPGANTLRAQIERNAIALLSNFQKEPLDPPSSNWLGLWYKGDLRERVSLSGLWNSDHVDKPYDPAFLKQMEQLVTDMEKTS
jgi:hypothetical protein